MHFPLTDLSKHQRSSTLLRQHSRFSSNQGWRCSPTLTLTLSTLTLSLTLLLTLTHILGFAAIGCHLVAVVAGWQSHGDSCQAAVGVGHCSQLRCLRRRLKLKIKLIHHRTRKSSDF